MYIVRKPISIKILKKNKIGIITRSEKAFTSCGKKFHGRFSTRHNSRIYFLIKLWTDTATHSLECHIIVSYKKNKWKLGGRPENKEKE